MGQQAQNSTTPGLLLFEPHYYYPKKSEIEKDVSFRAGVISCISKMVDDEETQDKIFEELDMYQIQQDNFGSEIATR